MNVIAVSIIILAAEQHSSPCLSADWYFADCNNTVKPLVILLSVIQLSVFQVSVILQIVILLIEESRLSFCQ
jgi:hypothetical protein